VGYYLIVLVALFGLMWLLLVRPQRKRQLQQAQMQDSIQPGVDVLTAGGIHATVRQIEGEIVHVEIAPGTTVRLDRRAIAAIEQEEPEQETAPAAETEPPSPVSTGES
jgi:preprotein translocase subunit YajC